MIVPHNRYNELKRNTIIIAIANIGSKAISFILAPLYSYYLTTSQYGTMDLVTTTIGLLMPLVCLDVYEATFRFASEKDYDRRKVLSTSLLVVLPGFIILAAISIGALLFASSPSIVIYMCAFLFLDSINQILSQFLRGEEHMRPFAVSGVINSVALLISNLIFLVLLRWELNGWMISFLIGKLAMLFYCLVKIRIKDQFSFKYFDKDYLKIFIKYCIPLLPTAMMWWIMNASDRYMLTFFIGTSVTGIYAVANKLPSIVSVFENVFYQSYQTSGINDLNNRNRDVFYSKVFNIYFSILSLGITFTLIFLKTLTVRLFDDAYSSAWTCTSILLIAVLVHALAGNLGSYYVIFKQTRGAFITSAVGAITNIILNAIFIPFYGMVGAATTTLIGYLVTFFMRWKDIKKFVSFKLDTLNVIWCVSSIAIEIILYYIPGIISTSLRILIFCALLIKERNIVLGILKH